MWVGGEEDQGVEDPVSKKEKGRSGRVIPYEWGGGGKILIYRDISGCCVRSDQIPGLPVYLWGGGGVN